MQDPQREKPRRLHTGIRLGEAEAGWVIADVPNQHVAAVSAPVVGVVFFGRIGRRRHDSHIGYGLELHPAVQILVARVQHVAPYLHVIEEKGDF